MGAVVVIAGCILALVVIRLRIMYSATYIHVVHFRTKLIKMAEQDPYWYGVYDKLPSLEKHVAYSIFRNMKSLLDTEAQEKYIIGILPQHEIKRSRKKAAPMQFEI